MAERVDDDGFLVDPLTTGGILKEHATVLVRALPVLDVAVLRAGGRLCSDANECVHVSDLGDGPRLRVREVVVAHAHHLALLALRGRLGDTPLAPVVTGRARDGSLLVDPLGAGRITEAHPTGVVALRTLPILDVAVLGAGGGLRGDMRESVHVVLLRDHADLHMGGVV